jgi:chlorite dismutase
MSLEERRAMMDEHIRVGRKYPAVKLNTTYSFGLDDQEFVVAFETDEPSDFRPGTGIARNGCQSMRCAIRRYMPVFAWGWHKH